MADHSVLAVLFVSLFIFVFFKYCLGQLQHPYDGNDDDAAAAALNAFRYDNVTRTALKHVVYDEFAGSASAQLRHTEKLNQVIGSKVRFKNTVVHPQENPLLIEFGNAKHL